MAPQEGILYVTMAPKPSLPPARFHDWYMNEHGPMRLRFPHIFRNGFRYRSSDSGSGAGQKTPPWMAVYDVADMQELTKEPYTKLRQPPMQSQRERDTMKEIDVDRRFYDLVREWKGEAWTPLEDVQQEGNGRVMVSASFSLKPAANAGELEKWYADQNVPTLSEIPGWLRTRLFVSSAVEPRDEVEYMALHEYEPENGLGQAEFKDATTTTAPPKGIDETLLVKEHRRRVYSLYYTFGPAPRDLTSLSSPDAVPQTSTDGKTRTLPGSTGVGLPAIESYITTADGVEIPYRLEGSWGPDAPLILLSNCILSEWGIWDDFVESFLSKPDNLGYRILRYNTRGRTSGFGSQPIDIDVLASDVVALLDALRVPKAAALIGVSMGGCTVLNAATRHPDRVAAFVTCDSPSAASPANQKAWEDRVAVADKQGATDGAAGEPVVGSDLAELTVRRWFTAASFDDPALATRIERVRRMIATNSLAGFKASVRTLYAYDVRERSMGSRVRAKFVVGAADGALPAVLERMSEEHGCKVGGAAAFKKVEGAGHLPMVENCDSFLEAVESFLREGVDG